MLIFAHNKDEITIDTNIRRILIHLLHLPESTSSATLEGYAKKLLPKGKSRDWHNALMDYGSAVLTARKTGIKGASTQSTFTGSDRWYRGKALKLLLAAKQRTLSRKRLGKQLELENARLYRILSSMEKDGLIVLQMARVRVA